MRSRRAVSRRRAGRFWPRQQFFQIDGVVASAVFETEGDLRIAQAGLGGATVGCPHAIAKKFLDGLPQIAPRLIEMARNAGFVLPEQPSDLRKRFFLGVIEAEPLLFLRFEAFKRGLQCQCERCDVTFAMRIAW